MRPDDEFHIDTTFSSREHTKSARLGAAVIAVVGIAFIIATMTTTVAETMLPMSDDYLQVLIPTAADGSEAVALTTLMNEIKDKAISISGTVKNLSEEPITGLVAVVQMTDTTGRFPQTQEIPIMPAELAPQAEGTFMAMATLQEKPAGFIFKLRLADGPFIPYKEEQTQIPGAVSRPQITK